MGLIAATLRNHVYALYAEEMLSSTIGTIIVPFLVGAHGRSFDLVASPNGLPRIAPLGLVAFMRPCVIYRALAHPIARHFSRRNILANSGTDQLRRSPAKSTLATGRSCTE
jgi:hypothetical protein